MSASDEEKSPSEKTCISSRVSKTVKLDVVELLKQVLQWTPQYKPGLNKALLQAAKVGSTGCVKILLSAGADVDTEDDNGDTPFVYAFRGRHADVMEVLRDAGCQTEIAKMSLALATRDAEFCKLCHKMEIPVENEDWNTKDLEEVRILLEELKLDPFEGQYGRNSFGDSPFMYLAQEGRPEVLAMMVFKHPCICKYSKQDRQERITRALHKAIVHRRLDNAKILISPFGAELEATDSQGRTAFMLACGHDETIAHYLLDLGANYKLADVEGLTPLHWSACVGYRRLCESLIHKGLDLNCRAKLGATPLMVACSNRLTSVVEVFLKAKADVNMATPEGWRALHVAVRACSPVIVRLLLNHDADPDAQSSRLSHNSDIVPGSSPLLIAIALSSTKTIQYLMNANCDLDQSGMVCTNPSFSSSESDLSEDDLKYQKQRCTPVQFAVMSRSWDIAEILIKAGCAVSSIRSWLEIGKGPVHIPEERLRTLKHLVQKRVSTPPQLKQVVRKRIRALLGRNLMEKVNSLDLPCSARNFLFYHELFRPTGGSFEV